MKKAVNFGNTEHDSGMRNMLRVVAPGRRDDPAAAHELCTGVIVEQELHDSRGLWIVHLEDGSRVRARRAAGCLLAPEKGDSVLLLHSSARTHYVLNVLEKAAENCHLDFPADVRVSAPLGGFSVQAREVCLSGEQGRLRFCRLDVLAQQVQTHVQQLVSALASVSMAAGRMTSRIGHALRLTGFELHRSGSVRQEVEGRFTVSSGQTTIVAEQDVTVDAGKINLG